jgi:hypothetical protein
MFSFNRRKQQIRLRSFFGRLIDLTSPNLSPVQGEARADDRYNRTVPVLVTPWENGGLVIDESVNGLTKDISDQGLAVTLQRAVQWKEVVIGFWLPSSPHVAASSGPTFALGEVRQKFHLGGGYWQLGISVTRLLEVSDMAEIERLVPLAANLLPPGDREPAPVAEVSG